MSIRGWLSTLLVVGALVVVIGIVFAFLEQSPEYSDSFVEPSSLSEGNSPAEITTNHENNQSQDTVAVWTVVDKDTVEPHLLPKYKEQVWRAAIVKLSDELKDLQVGDEISILVPQERSSYPTTIIRVETGLGNTSYTGRLNDYEFPLSFLITLSDSHTFANFSTPFASYELVGNASYAWLMNTANIDQRVDYSKPDVIIDDRHSTAESLPRPQSW